MLDLHAAESRPQHRNDVEAYLGVTHGFGDRPLIGEPATGKPTQPGGFGRCDRVEWRAETDAATRLDLAHHQHGAFDGDDVDLAVAAPPVALQHREAVSDQMIDSDLLTKLAKFTARCRANCHGVFGL